MSLQPRWKAVKRIKCADRSKWNAKRKWEGSRTPCPFRYLRQHLSAAQKTVFEIQRNTWGQQALCSHLVRKLTVSPGILLQAEGTSKPFSVTNDINTEEKKRLYLYVVANGMSLVPSGSCWEVREAIGRGFTASRLWGSRSTVTFDSVYSKTSNTFQFKANWTIGCGC